MVEQAASVGAAILATGDTPERRAIVNAYEVEQLELKRLIVAGFDDMRTASRQRGEQMEAIDADIKLTLDRMHRMANMVQGMVEQIHDQALYSSLLDERLTKAEDEITAIKKHLGL